MADENKSSGLGWAFLIGGGLAIAAFALKKKQDNQDIQITHRECMNGNCEQVFGEGVNECEFDGDCPLPFIDITHKECVNGSCIEVFGLGDDTCVNDGDCPHIIHRDCIGGFCQWVDGVGFNRCINVGQVCTHKRCIADQNGIRFCREVQGAEVDQCGVIGEFCR
ncbi:MAG: hypothetical protein Q7R52_02995 [archaeon]|nr:hypothetical protein [archaeon]